MTTHLDSDHQELVEYLDSLEEAEKRTPAIVPYTGRFRLAVEMKLATPHIEITIGEMSRLGEAACLLFNASNDLETFADNDKETTEICRRLEAVTS